MKIRLLGSSVGEQCRDQYLMSMVVNDSLVIDAGCLGLTSLDRQQRIRHVLLTHSHLDHVATLAIFLDNVYVPGSDCPAIYASDSVQQALCSDIFNGRIWPDLIELSRSETPFLSLHTLEHLVPIVLDGLQVTPVLLDHVVPTMGFVVQDDTSAFAFVSDTNPTSDVWQLANATENLKMVFLETSFPNRMSWLAERSKHLTPALMRDELKKLEHDVPIVIVHTKSAFRDEVESEIEALGNASISIVEPERDYVL